MELELATTDDIIAELRKRRMRFVFAGVENTNDARCAAVFSAGQARSRGDLLRMIRMVHDVFAKQDEASESE